MGTTGPGVWNSLCWPYSTSSAAIQVGTVLTLPWGVISLGGAGCTSVITKAQIIEYQCTSDTVTVSAEKYCNDGSHACMIFNLRKRTLLTTASRSFYDRSAPRAQFRKFFVDMKETRVTTDGSYKEGGTATQLLLQTTHTNDQCSIVCKGDCGVYPHFVIVNDSIKHLNSFTTPSNPSKTPISWISGATRCI